MQNIITELQREIRELHALLKLVHLHLLPKEGGNIEQMYIRQQIKIYTTKGE